MHSVLEIRERIYDHFQGSKCGWIRNASHSDFITYCIGKDTILDTAESLMAHRDKNFSADIYERYIEYYGVLQALYMQQDAIRAIHKLFLGADISPPSSSHWSCIRELRNDTVGHPMGRKNFLNRNEIGYGAVTYLWWPEGKRFPEPDTLALGTKIDGYAAEAAGYMRNILHEVETVCAEKHA